MFPFLVLLRSLFISSSSLLTREAYKISRHKEYQTNRLKLLDKVSHLWCINRCDMYSEENLGVSSNEDTKSIEDNYINNINGHGVCCPVY
jgi:hypothetical protein